MSNEWVEFIEIDGLSKFSDGRSEIELTKDGGIWVRLLEGSNNEFEILQVDSNFYSSGVEHKVEVSGAVVNVNNENIDHETMEFMRGVSLESSSHHLFAKECFLRHRYNTFPIFFNEVIKVDGKGIGRLKEILDEFTIDYSNYII